jgi:predicted MFS family arabinose efflux permease
MPTGRFSALRSAFSNRNFAIYISCNSLSLIGYWMQRIAVMWLTWEISHSEFWVGAVAFAEICPLFIIGPPFGVWADRFDRRTLAVVIQLLMLLQCLLLFTAIRFDALTIGLLFSLTLFEGMIQAAYQPVRLALVPNLVRKQDLVSAAAFTAVTFNVARFVGPAIAGIVFTYSGPEWMVLFNAMTYCLLTAAWFAIRLPAQPDDKPPAGSLLGDLRDGMRYVLERPPLFAMFMLLTINALFARPLTYLFSAFTGAVYNAGPETLALLTSSVGIGAIIAGMKLSMEGKTRGLIRSILVNLLVTATCMAGFAFTTYKPLAVVLIFFFGYSITIVTVAAQTLVQTSVDDHMRGRVLSLWVAFTRGAPALGVLTIGWVANHIGLMWPTAVAAFLGLGGMVLMLRHRRQMRSFFETDSG